MLNDLASCCLLNLSNSKCIKLSDHLRKGAIKLFSCFLRLVNLIENGDDGIEKIPFIVQGLGQDSSVCEICVEHCPIEGINFARRSDVRRLVAAHSELLYIEF